MVALAGVATGAGVVTVACSFRICLIVDAFAFFWFLLWPVDWLLLLLRALLVDLLLLPTALLLLLLLLLLLQLGLIVLGCLLVTSDLRRFQFVVTSVLLSLALLAGLLLVVCFWWLWAQVCDVAERGERGVSS